MPFSICPFRRFPMCCAQLISRGCTLSAYIILIFILAGCFIRQTDSPKPSDQAACLSGTRGSCFYRQESLPKINEKLVIFVHGVFSSSADAWGDLKSGKTWPDLVTDDENFKDYDIYLVNYRTEYVTPAPDIYPIAKRELERMKDRGIFKQYKEIYFIAHSMGGLVAKNLLTELNRKEDEPLLRQVRGVVFLGTPSQGASVATLAAWLSFNPQLTAMKPAHLNQWIAKLEEDWDHLMTERAESRYPRAFCAFESRRYPSDFYGVIVVPREAAFSRCDDRTELDFHHLGLAKPIDREHDPYDWAMAKISGTSKALIDFDDIKVLFECYPENFVKVIPLEGGPKVEMFFPRSPTIRASFIQDLGIPSQANIFSDPEKNGGKGHACRITSYEQYPVLNIELDFELRFKEPIYKPGYAVTGGAITSAIPWTSIIQKVEPNVPFVFYLINDSEYVLEADTPVWIYFQRLGEFRTRTARLPTYQGPGRLYFGPLKYPLLPKK